MTQTNRLDPRIGSGCPVDDGTLGRTPSQTGSGAGFGRAALASGLCVYLALAAMTGAYAEEEKKRDPAADRFLELGTPKGVLGGAEQKAFELSQIKTQIKSFIPPLLRPAITQHAFVLPPGMYAASVTHRYTSLDGDDFFRDGEPDLAHFKDFGLERNLTDFDFFYGFDLQRKYLHGFTFRVNVPLLSSRTHGFVHPGGLQAVRAENISSTQEVGDIGLFLKKKLVDQGVFPFGVAAVAGISLPTGDNKEKFGSDGRINIITPMVPGGMNAVFKRFADDGRLPCTLQPGTGAPTYLLGTFVTRQFSAGDLPGRSAAHIGAAHRFVSESDGVDCGDTTTAFASFVKPVYKDYLALDLSFIGIHKQDDEYKGLFPKPGTGPGSPNPLVLIPRPPFSGGFTGMIAPSLIFSPDPQIRFTISGLVRAIQPDLGPAPPWVIRANLEVIF